MLLTFRPIDRWPESWDRNSRGKSNPFQSLYSTTLTQLVHELEMIQARDAYLQVDVPASQIRVDGMLRADATANYRGVILTIDSATHGILTYTCDAFEVESWQRGERDWQVNLRAIMLGLEALRKLERYGIADRGQQYAGFAQLGSGIAMGRSVEHKMSVEEAWKIVTEGANAQGTTLTLFPDLIRGFYSVAARRLHPDRGGDVEVFKKLVEARDLLLERANG